MKKVLLVFISLIALLIIVPGSQAQQRADLSPKIINGSPAKIADWPWITYFSSIPTSWPADRHYPFCTGQLVAQRWVLTAAHCFDGQANIKQLRVAIGRPNTADQSQGVEMDLKLPGNYFFHPGWHPIWDCCNYDDLMLIRLPRSVTNITPVAIANRRPAQGSMVQLAGFGHYQNDPIIRADRLMQTSARLSDHCRYDPTKPGSNPREFFCTQFINNSSVCYGDSGGPIAYQGRLVGVNAFMINGCPTSDKPRSWATDIIPYKNWINDTVSKNGRTRLAVNYHFPSAPENKNFRHLKISLSQQVSSLKISISSPFCIWQRGQSKCLSSNHSLAKNFQYDQKLNLAKTTIPLRAQGSCLKMKITTVDYYSNKKQTDINRCGWR